MSENLLSKMFKFASDMHAGQFDRAGKAYFRHVYQVMTYIEEKYDDDEELSCIAIGHDLIEDTDVDYKILCDLFTKRIADGILALSKVDGESEKEYLNRIISNIDAIRVKMADIRHNTDILRLKGIREKDFKRLEKYHNMFVRLRVELEIYNLGK